MKPKHKRLLTALGSLTIVTAAYLSAPAEAAARSAEACSFGYCGGCSDDGCTEVGCAQVGCLIDYCTFSGADYVVCG